MEHLVIRGTAIEDGDISPLWKLPRLAHVVLDKKKEYEPTYGELKTAIEARKKSTLTVGKDCE
jgi:hypothetical protein